MEDEWRCAVQQRHICLILCLCSLWQSCSQRIITISGRGKRKQSWKPKVNLTQHIHKQRFPKPVYLFFCCRQPLLVFSSLDGSEPWVSVPALTVDTILCYSLSESGYGSLCICLLSSILLCCCCVQEEEIIPFWFLTIH